MVQLFDLVQRCVGDDLLVGQHRHPVTDGIQRVQIVCDQEDGQAQRFLQGLDEPVEGALLLKN